MSESREFHGTNSPHPQGFAHDPTPGRRRPNLATLVGVRREMARVYVAMKTGKLPSQDGTRLAYVLTSIAKLIESSDLQQRIEALEATLTARRH